MSAQWASRIHDSATEACARADQSAAGRMCRSQGRQTSACAARTMSFAVVMHRPPSGCATNGPGRPVQSSRRGGPAAKAAMRPTALYFAAKSRERVGEDRPIRSGTSAAPSGSRNQGPCALIVSTTRTRPGNTPSGGTPPRPAIASAAAGPPESLAADRVRISRISRTSAANRPSLWPMQMASAAMLAWLSSSRVTRCARTRFVSSRAQASKAIRAMPRPSASTSGGQGAWSARRRIRITSTTARSGTIAAIVAKPANRLK